MELPIGHNRLVFGVAGLTAFAASIYVIGFAPLPFVASIWRAEWAWNDGWSPEGSLKIRHRMADSLMASNDLIGKSAAQVAELLGAPPDTDYFREFDFVYVL